MEHRWTVLCRRSLTDSTTGKVSLVDVIEEIERKDTDQEGFNFEIFTSWFSTVATESKFKIAFLTNEGEELSTSQEFSVEFQAEGFARSAVELESFSWPEGRYYFKILILKDATWHDVANIPISIKVRAPQNIEEIAQSSNANAP